MIFNELWEEGNSDQTKCKERFTLYGAARSRCGACRGKPAPIRTAADGLKSALVHVWTAPRMQEGK